MPTTLRGLDGRTLQMWDGLVLFWVVLWSVLGVMTGVTLWHAADAGDSISSSGRALESVGRSLQDLASLPLVPDRPGKLGTEIVGTAADISQRGQEVKGQLHELGLLLGVAVVGIPVMPVLGFYLPLRVLRHREVESVRVAIRRGPDDVLDRLLAERARASLPYDVVVKLLTGSSQDSTDRDSTRRLAEAELSRLGLARPSAD